MTRSSINCVFKRVSKELGIHVSPHMLRHTYATNCISQGINIHTLQSQMGHSDIRTTSLYLSMNSEQNYLEIQKLQ